MDLLEKMTDAEQNDLWKILKTNEVTWNEISTERRVGWQKQSQDHFPIIYQ